MSICEESVSLVFLLSVHYVAELGAAQIVFGGQYWQAWFIDKTAVLLSKFENIIDSIQIQHSLCSRAQTKQV